MDDFEKEFPDFDWKNTPAYKHPEERCPYPKTRIHRNRSISKQVNEGDENQPKLRSSFVQIITESTWKR